MQNRSPWTSGLCERLEAETRPSGRVPVFLHSHAPSLTVGFLPRLLQHPSLRDHEQLIRTQRKWFALERAVKIQNRKARALKHPPNLRGRVNPMLGEVRCTDAVALKNIFSVDAALRGQILFFDRAQNVFDLMRLQLGKLRDRRFRGHSGFADEARTRLQCPRDAVEKRLHIVVREKAKAVTKTIRTVVDACSFDVAHVAENEVWPGRPDRWGR